MEIKQVSLIYFSATGTTRKILESIAKGIATEQITHINLTLPEHTQKTGEPFSNELVIMGAPVYGGRLPADAVKRFKTLKAGKTPAVLIVLYGNREFEDALLEFKHLAVELGFIPVAGGAFIGEHSFSTEALPIAKGRPDSRDLQTAVEFGTRVREKLLTVPSPGDQPDLELPGRFPCESPGARVMEVSPVTLEDDCTLCGDCAGLCPTAAISVTDAVTTETAKCIRCCACIKNCPEQARLFQDDMMDAITRWLNENCSARKAPEVFGVDM